MIEILLMVLVMLMARKRRGGTKFRRYLKGTFEVLGDVSALAGLDAAIFAVGNSVNERTFISSVKATYTLSNLTEGFSIGPIIVGVAHSDYTAAEIEEWIETGGSWDEGNLVRQEVAKRKIRQVGVFGTPAQALGIVSLNDGKPITTKCKWILLQAQSVVFWVYNSGSNNVATTSPELAVSGHANLWPR